MHQLPSLKEPTECSKGDCFTHTSRGRGNCKKEGLVYKGTCLTCLEKGLSSEPDKEGKVRRVRERKTQVKSIYWGSQALMPIQGSSNTWLRSRSPQRTRRMSLSGTGKISTLGRGGRSSTGLNLSGIAPEPCPDWWGGVLQAGAGGRHLKGRRDNCKPVVGRVVITNTVHTGRR